MKGWVADRASLSGHHQIRNLGVLILVQLQINVHYRSRTPRTYTINSGEHVLTFSEGLGRSPINNTLTECRGVDEGFGGQLNIPSRPGAPYALVILFYSGVLFRYPLHL